MHFSGRGVARISAVTSETSKHDQGIYITVGLELQIVAKVKCHGHMIELLIIGVQAQISRHRQEIGKAYGEGERRPSSNIETVEGGIISRVGYWRKTRAGINRA